MIFNSNARRSFDKVTSVKILLRILKNKHLRHISLLRETDSPLIVNFKGNRLSASTKARERAACAGRKAKRITGVRFPQNKIEKTDVENVRNFFGDSKGNRLTASARRASVQPVRVAKRDA